MYACMHVFMVGTFSRVWINRLRLPVLLVVSWTGKMIFPLSPFAPENFDLARQVLSSRPAPARSFSITHGIPPTFRDGVHILCRQPPSGVSDGRFLSEVVSPLSMRRLGSGKNHKRGMFERIPLFVAGAN